MCPLGFTAKLYFNISKTVYCYMYIKTYQYYTAMRIYLFSRCQNNPIKPSWEQVDYRVELCLTRLFLLFLKFIHSPSYLTVGSDSVDEAALPWGRSLSNFAKAFRLTSCFTAGSVEWIFFTTLHTLKSLFCVHYTTDHTQMLRHGSVGESRPRSFGRQKWQQAS